MRPSISKRGSARPSVGPSVRPSVTLSSKSRKINIFEQISDRGGILDSLYASLHLSKMVYRFVGLSIHRSNQELSHLVTSSYNRSINMRTHRWPYGPCLMNRFAYFFAIIDLKLLIRVWWQCIALTCDECDNALMISIGINNCCD